MRRHLDRAIAQLAWVWKNILWNITKCRTLIDDHFTLCSLTGVWSIILFLHCFVGFLRSNRAAQHELERDMSAPAWKLQRSRWLGITLTAQCQPVSLVCHPIQDYLLALNKHRKWHTKIRHEQFEGTIELEYENPPRYASIKRQVCTAGLPLKGQRPLKCDRINKHIYFAQLVWNAFIYFISALGELRMCRVFSVIISIFLLENAEREAAGWW